MTIWVTGADGQLGHYLQRRTQDEREDRYLFTNRTRLDITDEAAVRAFMEEYRPDVILNCAAYTDVERAEEEESAAYAVNATAVGYLADAAKRQDALLIHISTDFVFMGGCCAPLTEQSQPNPINAYGRSKLAGEEAIRRSGCHHITIRTAWLYGAVGRNFVRTIYERSAQQTELRVVDDQIGSPTYAADLANALVQIVATRCFKEGLYHYTNLGSCSRWELADAVCRLAHRITKVQPCRSEEIPTKARRPMNCVLEKRKFQATFGMEIPHWRESLKRCLDEEFQA